jgi:type I restriction enzyme M protein
MPGFVKAVTLSEIAEQGFVLTPGRYVGAAEAEEDGEPVQQRLTRLREELFATFDEGQRLERAIREHLKDVG